MWQVYQMSVIGILPMMQLEKGGESPTKTGLLGSGVRYIQQNNSEVVIKTCSICAGAKFQKH